MHASLRFAQGAPSLRLAVLTTLVTLFGLAAPASAQMPQRITVGDGAVMCAPLPSCDPAMLGACSGVRGTCKNLPGHAWSYCTTARPPESEAFCCATNSDCPEVGGSSGNCAAVTGLSDASPRVCIDTTRDWCVGDLGEIDIVSLWRCLTPPGGVVSSGTALSWKKGDCDRDGIANGMDGCACRPGSSDSATPGCPSLTADAGVSDGGVSRLDGGLRVDASMPDAGMVSDSGPPSDAGDSGRPRDDAGARTDADVAADSGSPPVSVDSGAAPAEDASTGGSFTGAGGCSLTAGRAHSSAGVLVLALLGLAVRRRRRH